MAAEFTPVQAVDALVPAITLLGFGAASALVTKAARLSPIVGYLIVGILIGQYSLGLIHESPATHLLDHDVWIGLGVRGRLMTWPRCSRRFSVHFCKRRRWDQFIHTSNSKITQQPLPPHTSQTLSNMVSDATP